MRRKGYIFTNKDNALKGIMSTILGVIGIITLVLVIYYSFKQKGIVSDRSAAAALLITAFSLTGIVLAAIGLFEKEKFHLFPALGLILNAITIGIISLIIYLG